MLLSATVTHLLLSLSHVDGAEALQSNSRLCLLKYWKKCDTGNWDVEELSCKVMHVILRFRKGHVEFFFFKGLFWHSGICSVQKTWTEHFSSADQYHLSITVQWDLDCDIFLFFTFNNHCGCLTVLVKIKLITSCAHEDFSRCMFSPQGNIGTYVIINHSLLIMIYYYCREMYLLSSSRFIKKY